MRTTTAANNGQTSENSIRTVATVSPHSHRQCLANVGRLSQMLNNNVMHKNLVLVNNSPNVKGSALLLRVYSRLKRGRGVLCVSNRRSRNRLGLHTSHLRITISALFILYRGSLSAILTAVRRRGPSVIVISSVRAVG